MRYRFIIIPILIVGLLFLIYKVNASSNKIPVDILSEYASNKEIIIKNVLTACGKTEWFKSINHAALNVLFGDICGDGNTQAIITIKLNEKTSIIAVYKKEKVNYIYDCLVDTFFNIKDVQLLNLKEEGKDIILVREYADQLAGAFEAGTFIRGYIYNTNDFKLILNIVEDYKAYWNELWNKEHNNTTHWLKVTQSAKVKWENASFPVLQIVYTQSLFRSINTNKVTLPDDSNFDIAKTKELFESYYWSSKWKHFILAEGYDSKTGQEVAIVEDLSNTLFALTKSNNSFRIKNKNGTTEIVDKSRIKKIDHNKEEGIFII